LKITAPTRPVAAALSMLLLPALSGNAWGQGQETIVEVQELVPVESGRNIRTTNFDLLFRIRSFDTPDFKFHGGLTVSHARGSITRQTGSFQAGTLKDENYASAATGAGPVLAIRAELARGRSFSASLTGSVGVLLYNRDFPAGASRYEFMIRYGPTVSYRLNERQDLSLTLRGMHVSNGQGFNFHNPQYNAIGFGVQFLGAF
jgi:lipid A 3-O-deacylase PagL